MPPRASLTNTFSVTDVNNEVVCPLHNQDGSACRKRCLGEKRFRSMQEHIRRAHPEYYIPKLPATKESFELMISTPPRERPQQEPNHAVSQPQQIHHHHHQQQQQQQHPDPAGLSPAFPYDSSGLGSSYPGYGHAFGQHDGGYYTAGDTDATAIYNSMQHQRHMASDARRGSLIPAANAAAALASLHYHRPDSDWGGGDNMGQNFYADQSNDLKTSQFHVDPALEDMSFMPDHNTFHTTTSTDTPGLLPSTLDRSPTERPATMSSLQRSLSRSQHGRPRQKSLGQINRPGGVSKHERRKSKELKRKSLDKKAFSNDPTPAALYGKRWEDLIDAATSATEEDSRDLTPVPEPNEASPQVPSRTSLPPFALGSQFQSFQASPLNRALTPPPADSNLADLQPFPSVESSLSSHHQHHNSTSSGSQFQIMNPSSLTGTTSESSPMFQHQPVQIYCAGCRRLNVLKESYACTNCICGLCGNCVEALLSGQRTGRMSYCPRCNEISAFKPFQLDLR
ncbi:hypothetical protein K431DRAFT_288380 [Polychaeton citri CBS 116435]|uniref:RING zinc finger-like domain-containing protein n=1 Tax=Polychaeton citri CBS 116435 TaxID=1314669 RepID=A0A9P4PZ87_9PEZI|nr:hypothetical protein K431DRAFT_288380 [Polychaeton citri CBS 116435]